MTFEAYPLQWPTGRPRTPSYKREIARFDVSLARARDNVVAEVQRLVGRGARNPQTVLSTNLKLRLDGLPLANQRRPEDPGAAVYFLHKGKQMAFACDRWNAIEDNLQAIAKTIEALRGIERWGTGEMQAAAFTGFEALPPPAAAREWWDVLQCRRDSPLDVIRAQYRRLASEHHPDRGGDSARMAAINDAWAAAQRERA